MLTFRTRLALLHQRTRGHYSLFCSDPDDVGRHQISRTSFVCELKNPQVQTFQIRPFWIGECSRVEQHANDAADFLQMPEEILEASIAILSFDDIGIHEHQRQLDHFESRTDGLVQRTEWRRDSRFVTVLMGPTDAFIKTDPPFRYECRAFSW